MANRVANNDDASTASREDPVVHAHTTGPLPFNQPIHSDTKDNIVAGETTPSIMTDENTDKTTEKTTEVTVL